MEVSLFQTVVLLKVPHSLTSITAKLAVLFLDFGPIQTRLGFRLLRARIVILGLDGAGSLHIVFGVVDIVMIGVLVERVGAVLELNAAAARRVDAAAAGVGAAGRVVGHVSRLFGHARSHSSGS